MKKLRSLFLLIVASMAVGCSEGSGFGIGGGMIYDFNCYDVAIEVRDEQGNDLFDPENPNNVLCNRITVEYNGKTFVLGEDGRLNGGEETKATMPDPLAVKAEYNEYLKKNYFCFGEFSPEGGFKNEKFTIDWGNGTRDEIEFDLFITWMLNKPEVHKRVSLNGKRIEQENPFRFEIVRNIFQKQPIWDFACSSISFVVKAKDGKDLLNSENPENILNGIYIKYKDQIFTEIEPMSKALLPLPLAIREGYNFDLVKKTITFGEFSPTDDYHGEKIEVTWGDGSKDEVVFDYYITWDKYKNPTVHDSFILNGKKYTTLEPFGIRLIKGKV